MAGKLPAITVVQGDLSVASEKWWKFPCHVSPQSIATEAIPTYIQTNQSQRVISASWRPCLIPHSQSYSNQASVHNSLYYDRLEGILPAASEAPSSPYWILLATFLHSLSSKQFSCQPHTVIVRKNLSSWFTAHCDLFLNIQLHIANSVNLHVEVTEPFSSKTCFADVLIFSNCTEKIAEVLWMEWNFSSSWIE